MSWILTKYFSRKFLGLFLFCMLSVTVLFIIVDLVEHMDKFMDRDMPRSKIVEYYTYYIPSVLVLVMPVATLLATVFSVGGLAQNNEIIALKALGHSLYQTLSVVLVLGALLAAVNFFASEVLVAQTVEKRIEIERTYRLTRSSRVRSSRLINLEIRDNDRLVTLGRLYPQKQLATRISIETLSQGRIVSRLDADSISYNGSTWLMWRGYRRRFSGDDERASILADTLDLKLHVSPEALIRAQGKPEDMGYWNLRRYVHLLKRSGAEVHAFLTELHLRIAFPMSNIIIVLFGLPVAYNLRKRSVAVGFGVALAVTFFYFGLVKMGQTLGHNGSLPPMLAAWLGNGLMGVGSVVNLVKTRK